MSQSCRLDRVFHSCLTFSGDFLVLNFPAVDFVIQSPLMPSAALVAVALPNGRLILLGSPSPRPHVRLIARGTVGEAEEETAEACPYLRAV